MADRFALIAQDLAGNDVAAPAEAHPTEQHYETRQDKARLACQEAGIVWPATILPPGTALYSSGVATLKADRARWAKLPDAHTGIAVVKAALEAEDRRDFAVPVKELRLDCSTGRMHRAGMNGTPAGYDKHSFRQLVAQTPGCGAGEAPRSFAGALLHLDNDERAAVLNRRLPAAKSSVTLRTKMSHDGSRIVRAVLSEKYGDLNDIHVGEAIEYALNGDAKVAKLDYKPGDSRSQFEVIFPSQVAVKTFVVGDVHYAGIRISNSETGEGTGHVQAFLMRAACANLTLAAGDGVSIRHVGKTERLAGVMKAAVQAALLQLDPMIALIQKSATERVTDFTAKSPSEIIRALAKKYEVSDVTTAEWTKTYESSYAKSPTTWGITSALTEATQRSSDWWGQQADDEDTAKKIMEVGVRKALGF